MRFLVEAIRAIRKAVGTDFLIGVRMNGEDGVPGGLNLDDSVEIARRLAQDSVDYLNISGLTALRYPGWIADISAPESQFAPHAEVIRKAVDGLPICASSRMYHRVGQGQRPQLYP